ncbi:MAG: type II toxin-antitoxin system PemK/MazF family toxin [Bacteroidales bacterium]
MVKQYEIYWTNLDPTIGSEIKKTRPGVVISPDELNRHLSTILIAPLTSTIKNRPYRVKCNVKGKQGEIALDQIRCIDNSRLSNKIDQLPKDTIQKIKQVISEMLVE